MKKTLKKLSFGVTFAIIVFAAACSDVEIQPQGGGQEDDDTPIILEPTKPGESGGDSVADSLQIG